MWIFTDKGFISAVRHKEIKDSIVVRARVREHLRSLFPNEDIIESDDSDYQFRIFIDRARFTEFLVEYSVDLDYTNFKSSICDDEYHNHCLTVWSIMARMQPNINGNKKRRQI